MAKKQTFSIVVIDHRSTAPHESFIFFNHPAYLAKMAQLSNNRNGILHQEITQTVIELSKDPAQGDLFP